MNWMLTQSDVYCKQTRREFFISSCYLLQSPQFFPSIRHVQQPVNRGHALRWSLDPEVGQSRALADLYLIFYSLLRACLFCVVEAGEQRFGAAFQ